METTAAGAGMEEKRAQDMFVTCLKPQVFFFFLNFFLLTTNEYLKRLTMALNEDYRKTMEKRAQDALPHVSSPCKLFLFFYYILIFFKYIWHIQPPLP